MFIRSQYAWALSGLFGLSGSIDIFLDGLFSKKLNSFLYFRVLAGILAAILSMVIFLFGYNRWMIVVIVCGYFTMSINSVGERS
ncbi:hypothetical protein QA601_18730 [Chitinispirillales bacterium ANBcel5]|uniref:hypothetical protein n=1 Tax=Cellulosispirillum alkaliphilum TaxID=3039283 RepID=UPI002A574116|nr:hypothetical protein [Chitinispirillales bacterium ANBcel5]